jgi:hypothetical protein
MQREIDRLPSNQTEMVRFLETIYEEHHNRIRDFVQRHPSHALVEVNITEDSAGDVLAEAFGLDAKRWTQKNKNKKGILSLQWDSMEYQTFWGSTLWWILVVATTSFLGWTLGFRVGPGAF